MKETISLGEVADPYVEAYVHYLVIASNPCSPIIEEVEKGTEGAYATLVEAKEAARQIIQAAISEAKQSLNNLRQLGVEKIQYLG